MWEEYAKDPANALEWQQTYMNFMFDLEDSSGKFRRVRFLYKRVYIHIPVTRSCNSLRIRAEIPEILM